MPTVGSTSPHSEQPLPTHTALLSHPSRLVPPRASSPRPRRRRANPISHLLQTVFVNRRRRRRRLRPRPRLRWRGPPAVGRRHAAPPLGGRARRGLDVGALPRHPPVPDRLHHLLCRSEEELLEIQGTQLLSTTMGVKEYVQSEFNNVEAEIISANKDLFPGIITFDDFLWAFGILRSRVFSGLRGDKLALVPFADLMAPEDIRWDCDDQDGWDPSGPVLKRHPSNNGTMALSSWGRSRLSQNEPIKDYAPPQNGINRNICHIDVPNTDSVVIEVERVLSNPNMHEIEKARKLLKDQEQSLLDAIAGLDEASDSESEDMATEGRMGSAGDRMGRNGIAC